jgi:hypothetical protein
VERCLACEAVVNRAISFTHALCLVTLYSVCRVGSLRGPRFIFPTNLEPQDSLIPTGRGVAVWYLELHMIDLRYAHWS